MSNLKRILTCCVAVMAFGTLGVSAASATFTLTTTKCGVSGTIPTLCDATAEKGTELFELSGTETATATGGVSTFEEPSTELELKSTSVTGLNVTLSQTSPLTSEYKVTGSLEFANVTVIGKLEAKCEITSPVDTKPLEGTEATDGFLLSNLSQARGGNWKSKARPARTVLRLSSVKTR